MDGSPDTKVVKGYDPLPPLSHNITVGGGPLYDLSMLIRREPPTQKQQLGKSEGVWSFSVRRRLQLPSVPGTRLNRKGLTRMHTYPDAYISRSRAPTHAALSPIGELHCIGATTLAEYREHMEKDAAFERRFQQVCGGGRDEGAEGGEGGYQGGREGRRSGVFEDGRGSSSVR